MIHPQDAGSGSGELAFLQHRVGRFGRMACLVSLVALGVREGVLLATGGTEYVLHPTIGLHVVGAASLGAIWLLCRGGRRSRRFVRTVEFGGLVGAALALGAMGFFIPLADRPDLVITLAIGLIYVARSVYVPSTGLTTLLLGVALALPTIAASGVAFGRIEPGRWRETGVDWWSWEPSRIAAVAAGTALLWWVIIVTVATVGSNVIYGLRRQVRDVRRLGQYTLVERLGQGGMGEVWRARHAMLRRPTAVKLLLPERMGPEALGRFEKEVQLTARLSHPNTVTVFDYGRTEEGVFYYAMELIDGSDLATIVAQDGPQPPGRVVHVLRQAAGALAEAHGAGLIHRDVKPSNVMLCTIGGMPDFVKVLDFGLVKELGGGGAAATHAGLVLGTPLYMSPEAIERPAEVDGRSDLYALGAVAYFMITGRHVFTGDTWLAICSHHLHGVPAPPSERTERHVPADLEALVLACLAKDPAERPPSAEALLARLEGLAGVEPWTAADARAWWRAYRPPPRGAAAAGDGSDGTTFRIDLDRLDDGPVPAAAPDEASAPGGVPGGGRA